MDETNETLRIIVSCLRALASSWRDTAAVWSCEETKTEAKGYADGVFAAADIVESAIKKGDER